MSGLLRGLCGCLWPKQERKVVIVIIGLDNAGKTTLLNTLRGQPDQDTTPSYGFTSHSVQEGDQAVQLYDLGGGRNIRRIWKTYLPEVHGAIFVVDAADPARFSECGLVVQQTLAEPQLLGKPVLVLANKQDLSSAAAAHEVASALGLADETSRPAVFSILGCVARPAAGQEPDPTLRQGLGWLVQKVNGMYGDLNPRVEREAAAAMAAEEQRKREREVRAKAAREERLREEAKLELANKQKHQAADPSASAGLIPASIAPEPAATAAATAPMQLPGATASVAPEAALKRDFSDLKDLAATPRLERSQAEAAAQHHHHHHHHHHQQHVDSDTDLAGGHNSSSSNAAAAEACDASTTGVSSSHCQSGSEAPLGTQQQLQQGQHGQQQQQQQEGALTEHGRRTSRSLGNRVQPIDPANAA